MSKKKNIIFIIFIVIVLPLIVWGVSILKCEILTSFYGDEFVNQEKISNTIGKTEYLKVLEYSDSSARVYYISHDFLSGEVFTFINENEEWFVDEWEKTIWSKHGSADDFIWPYIIDTLRYSLNIK
ncbi:MAG: hypothetical protein IKU42_03450 [Oscillospiraceae bacterium]|nr:hypothetical protein [Oscillospiraceae bacterium]